MFQIKVSAKRHLAKTISYRVISTGIGFLAMWWATGSVKVGAAFSVIELIYKPIQYYIHERIWYRYIKYGLIERPDKKKNRYPFTDEIIKDPKPKKTNSNPIKTVINEDKPKKKVLNYSSNR